MQDIQQLFPSIDGNTAQRELFLQQVTKLITGLDEMKDKDKLVLGEMPEYKADYYNRITEKATVPNSGIGVENAIEELLELSQGQRFVNSRYVANAAPLPNNASVIGTMLMSLLNGNNIWDVEGATASHAEVHIVSALSKIVGYDAKESSGYTTWGGQGAVFNSLRIAISKRFPNANREGVPRNLYAFCSELSHFSLYKAVEATGIGTNNLIKVSTNEDDSMNVEDLHRKMIEVIESGGIPVYVLATMGTTDSFGVDDILAIKGVLTAIEETYGQGSIYLHGDTAMGGMFTFFNYYDFSKNMLGIEEEVLEVLSNYRSKFLHTKIADSMVFDFHKLGQTPYTTSLFLLKNKQDFKYVDLDEEETPYVGNRGFGSYHTSYTLECSRSGSSIPILASLLALGVEGYQKLLANYIRVNMAFRKALTTSFKTVSITNKVSPVTTFRFYPDLEVKDKENKNFMTLQEINETNIYNSRISENLGSHRNTVYFGSTSKQRLVKVVDTDERVPLYVHKFFSISPYTTIEEIPTYIDFLKEHIKEDVEELVGV